MGDNHYLSQQMNSLNMFAFLNGLLQQVRHVEEEAREEIATEVSQPVQTISVEEQNHPEPGGYPEDVFLFLTEKEKDEYSCAICYCILRDPFQCKNLHRFCHGCIYAWSTTKNDSSEYCPVCRCEALYAKNTALNEKILNKCCCCRENGCNWRGRLRERESHEHRQYTLEETSLGVGMGQKALVGSHANKDKTEGTIYRGLTSILPSMQSTSEFLRDLRRSTEPSTSPNPSEPQNLLSRRESQTSRRIPVPPTQDKLQTNRRFSQQAAASSSNSSNANRLLSRAVRTNGSGTTEVTTNLQPLNRKPGNTPRPSVNRNQLRKRGMSQPNITTTSTTSTPQAHEVPTETSPPRIDSTLPQINNTSFVTVSSSSLSATDPPLEYRRLVPQKTQADRVTSRLREGREQLAMMLTLMTLELEDRRRNIQRQLTLNMQRERIHAEQMSEVNALNQRLSRLASSFDAPTSSNTNGSLNIQTPTTSRGRFGSNSTSYQYRSPSPEWNAQAIFGSDSDS